MQQKDHAVFVLIVSRDLDEIDVMSRALEELCGSYQLFVDYAQGEEDLHRKRDERMNYQLALIGESYFREEGPQAVDLARADFPDAQVVFVHDGRVVNALEVFEPKSNGGQADKMCLALRNAAQALIHNYELVLENKRLAADLKAKDLELTLAAQRMEELETQQETGGQALDCTTLLSRIRHEVNNPLTGVLGQAQLLLRRPDQLPEDARHRVETIEKLTLRISEVFRNFDQSPQGQPVAL